MGNWELGIGNWELGNPPLPPPRGEWREHRGWGIGQPPRGEGMGEWELGLKVSGIQVRVES